MTGTLSCVDDEMKLSMRMYSLWMRAKLFTNWLNYKNLKHRKLPFDERQWKE